MKRWFLRLPYRSKLFWVRAVILAGLAYLLFLWKVFWSPDSLFVIFLIIFSLFGQFKQYLVRFLPFAALLLAYDSFRSIVPFLNSHVHYTEMIDFDRWLGRGGVPTLQLQHLLFPNGALHWYDFYFYSLYMAHFLAPFILAIVIWKLRPQQYWVYITALIGLSFAGFLTYLAFPAAPPWLAAQKGLIPPITHLSTNIWWAFGVHNFPTIWSNLNPNPVAAVPSLHAAYPTLDWLFVWRLFGRKVGAIFALYPLSIYVGVVYLGEHYVFDVALGILYAVAAYVVVTRFVKRGWTFRRLWHNHGHRFKRIPAYATGLGK